jgi:uncharacterized protein (DUF1501 family)
MDYSRRNFIRAAGIAAAASPLGWMQALAAGADDYKALVCVFLFGGNDGNNMVIPTDTASYASYATARTKLAIAQANLSPLGTAATQGGQSYGLHPSLAAIAPLYAQGKLAVVANIGTLRFPLSKAEYAAKSKPRPLNLFSHSDQQNQWLTSESASLSLTGWGGRVADAVMSSNTPVTVPAVMSLTGSSLFCNGRQTSPLVVPSSGTFGLSGTGTTALQQARMNALNAVLRADRSNALVAASADVLIQAITSAGLINPIMQANSSVISSAFNGLNTGIANQLKGVAKLIESRAQTGLKRQVFFVALNGFDTHSNQLNNQQNLFNQLGPALAAFYSATVALGIADKVTTFTSSDFGRTLKANDTGTDHAWGNHHLVLGGAVKGNDVYGVFPSLTLKGPDDADGAGRWIPTVSVDQYAATLATWLGVSASDLATVLPNLSRFTISNLGFV